MSVEAEDPAQHQHAGRLLELVGPGQQPAIVCAPFNGMRTSRSRMAYVGRARELLSDVMALKHTLTRRSDGASLDGFELEQRVTLFDVVAVGWQDAQDSRSRGQPVAPVGDSG
ncbi:MAG: hypothetical protein R3B89_00480 [Polyangiaceae bacterium]